jgi:ABC-type transporter Mla MlaB component
VTIHVSQLKHHRKTVLKVDGQLKVGDVDELTKAFRSANHIDLLDLSELQSADSAGLAVLRELVSSGVQIRHASPFIELLMKANP